MSRADRKHGRFVFIAWLLTISSFVGFNIWINHKQPYWATERILAEQITWCYKHRSEIPNKKELDVVDGWGNPLIYARKVYPKSIIHGVKSAGPDGVFGTDDDMVAAKTDLNKSKIIGEWLGQKGRQVVGGIKEGIKKPSEFDPEEKEEPEEKKWWKFGKKTAKNPED